MSLDTLQQHELGRVTSMTDDQLDLRYTKMTKPEKIEAFHRALIQENRNPSLQKQISEDRRTGKYGLATSVSWDLFCDKDGSVDTWTFRTHDHSNIQISNNGVVYDERFANGYYPTESARAVWDLLVSKGYKTQ
jgi:hypothetical protein